MTRVGALRVKTTKAINHVADTDGEGIKVTGSRNLIVRNSCSKITETDYVIDDGNSFGPIVAGGAGEITNQNPWANFQIKP